MMKNLLRESGQIILLGSMLLGTFTASASAQSTPAADLAGWYTCEGVSKDGRPYHGLVEIVKHRDVYQLFWSFDAEIGAVGIGIRSGNVLAVMHYTGEPGVVAYRIEDGSRLVGEWTVAGADGAVFSETLTKTTDRLHEPPKPESSKPKPPRRKYTLPREVVIARHRM